MADKEERQKRLLIKEYDLVCDLTDCEYCEEKDWCSEKDGMTHQEAIERMAKALCITYGEECETCRFKGNEKGCKRYLEFRNYIAMAEAALEELLEDENGR